MTMGALQVTPGGTLSKERQPNLMEDWTATVINYNGADLVCETIASLKRLVEPPAEIVLVDDGSSDGSVAAIRLKHPDVRIASMGRNTGVLNKVRNRALIEARYRYVLITDNDITFSPDAVVHLMMALKQHDATVCTPVVAVEDAPSAVFTQGHGLHFLCWSTRRRWDAVDAARAAGPHPAIGCGIQMVDTSRMPQSGFFDDHCVLGWGDDGEFHFRLELTGNRCFSVPDAVVFHRRVRTSSRFYGQIHNRWLMMAKDYQLKTLLAIAPALLVYEVLLIAWMVSSGAGRDYVRAIRDVAGKAKWIREQRRLVQQSRRVPDTDILCAEDLVAPRHFAEQWLVGAGLKLLSVSFRTYWRAVRVVLR